LVHFGVHFGATFWWKWCHLFGKNGAVFSTKKGLKKRCCLLDIAYSYIGIPYIFENGAVFRSKMWHHLCQKVGTIFPQKSAPKVFKIDQKVVQKSTKRWPRNRPKNGPKMDQKMVQKWTKNWSKNQLKNRPEIDQKMVQKSTQRPPPAAVAHWHFH